MKILSGFPNRNSSVDLKISTLRETQSKEEENNINIFLNVLILSFAVHPDFRFSFVLIGRWMNNLAKFDADLS